MERLGAFVEDTVKRYRQALERAFPGRVRRLVVFGSTARGTATEDSDVDVLVLLDRVSFAERGRALDLAAEVGLARGIVFGPLVLSLAEWEEMLRRERRLPLEIEREGIES